MTLQRSGPFAGSRGTLNKLCHAATSCLAARMCNSMLITSCYTQGRASNLAWALHRFGLPTEMQTLCARQLTGVLSIIANACDTSALVYYQRVLASLLPAQGHLLASPLMTLFDKFSHVLESTWFDTRASKLQIVQVSLQASIYNGFNFTSRALFRYWHLMPALSLSEYSKGHLTSMIQYGSP